MTSPPNPAEQADARLDAALRELHREVLQEPLPATLQQAAERVEAVREQALQGRQWMGMAAAVVLAFGVGWLAHGQLSAPADGLAQARRGVEHEFVRQARFAYSVYQPEKRHPVEVAATEQEHLVVWLSKRLGRPLKIPVLEAQGFGLVGGRLLPGDSGARAQFMFQNTAGQRITLYLGALDKAAAADSQATQFRFEPDAAVPSFYWAEQGFGYALSGPVDKPTLMALANSVYAQINRD
ncbi:anti-sigma factor [Rhodoferax lacus]|uniref:Anti-sigma factor n=1 Tax=Rhodoferax lacus TaxID=2184758 RepID=A0A3E1RD52_9BURK|nr:anti-sigma factor [Rhodoferax lacus]RFO97296.1 anti-sigma factor [Rhodoferax lacus]